MGKFGLSDPKPREPQKLMYIGLRSSTGSVALHCKGLSIYYVMRDGGGSSRFITILHRGGSPQFITILHRGGLESLLQYYSFERKMEGYIPFSALN